jgi:DNA (cytosine-5)-methyltransferase 1
MNVLDAFSGAGGIHLGLKAGLLNAKIVVATDIDKHVQSQYEFMFPETKYMSKGIQSLSKANLPTIDIFSAGFPCQSWSIAGKRRGFQDERGQIMFPMLDLIHDLQPQIVFLENVKNFKSINNGDAFAILISRLTASGYFITYKVMNSCEYTEIPQNRERIFIIGFLNKTHFDKFSWPDKIPLSERKTVKTSNILQPLTEINSKYYAKPEWKIFEKLQEMVKKENVIYQYRRFYVRENKNGLFPTLTANMGSGGHNVPFIVQNNQIRKLTPLESFRIQGFPAEYFCNPSIPDNALYRMAGNSVTVPLITLIAKQIQKAIV